MVLSRGRALSLALLPAALSLQVGASRAPESVEALYSRRAYPAIADLLGRASGSLPFAVGELLLIPAVVGVSWLGVWAWRSARRTGASVLAGALGALSVAVGSLWLAFLACWGLNYQRLPFATIARLDAGSASLPELRSACEALVDEADRLRDGLPEDAHGVLRLRDGPSGALRRVAAGYAEASKLYSFLSAAPKAPKPLLSSALFSYLGITGIYIPFTAEASVNVTVPEVELPFSGSHETAHRLGFSREDEANYLGYLACRLHPDRDFRYAGTLAAGTYALAALAQADRGAALGIAQGRTAAVRRDLQALVAWSERYRSRAANVSNVVNDAFLRSQGQREGVRSYGRMVDLLIAERRAGPI